MAIQGVPGGSSGAPALSARAIYGMGVGPGRLRQPENPSLRQPQGPPFGPGRGTLLPPPPPPPPDPLPPPSLCLPPNPQVQVAPSNPPSPPPSRPVALALLPPSQGRWVFSVLSVLHAGCILLFISEKKVVYFISLPTRHYRSGATRCVCACCLFPQAPLAFLSQTRSPCVSSLRLLYI
jgi:hypothetical protein